MAVNGESAFDPAWNSRPQPTLRTDRLTLRPFVPSDATRVYELAGDRALADTTQLPHPYPEEAAVGWVSSRPAAWTAGEVINYAIVVGETDDLVGTVSLVIRAWNESAELGYWVGRPYWGRGYATEAAWALIDFGFGTVGLRRIEGPYMVRNPASGRVMEKVGMRLEGVARQSFRKWGVWEDIATRAILREDWRAIGRATVWFVRRATAEDADAVRAIAVAAWKDTYAGLLRPETIDAFLAGPYAIENVRRRIANDEFLVADDARGLAGYADAVIEPERVFLAAIYTLPGQRRIGAGSALLTDIVTRHPDLPIDAFVLVGNVKGEPFYAQRGFVPVETVEGDLFGERVSDRRWRRPAGPAADDAHALRE